MNEKLTLRQLTLIGSMLFGMFFGAGNLIFPLILGAKAGRNLPAALLGLLITAAGIPLLGVMSIGLSRSEGLLDLSGRVSPRFRSLFTCALYLTIGPLFAIPRCAATSFTIGVSPFVGEGAWLWQFGFSLCFFGAVLYFSLKPSKILDSVGKFLNPAFLLFLGIMLVTALLNPVQSVSSVAPSGDYANSPFFAGFLQGYDTLDALASLAFGIIVIRTIRQLGVTEPGAVAGSTVKAGLVSMALMGLNCLILYMEDVYELEGEPRFGYMRGGYTREQLRQVDDYAHQYGISIVASIQVLGHLEKVLRFPEYASLQDSPSCLLAGEEKTYELIGKMLQTIGRCLRGRMVIVGMDETHGLGEGRYRQKNGVRRPLDIFLEHLQRVHALARENGLEVALYSDMLFSYSSPRRGA